MHPSNCLGIRSFADTHACRNLLRVAEKFAQDNFEEVRVNNLRVKILINDLIQVKESEEFRMLPYQQLIEIIGSDNLNAQSEEHVYNAVITWMKHDVADRRPHLSKVSLQLFFKLLIKIFKRFFNMFVFLFSPQNSLLVLSARIS